MKPILAAVSIAALLAAAPAAQAALKPGAKAPTFKATASLAGKPIAFDLATALKKGPVVLYFYPAAFTSGCNIEAHAFAEATDEFRKNGATVVGVSRDDIATLHRFSVEKCGSKFAVASDKDGAITRAYDAVLQKKPEYADRTSYVIAKNGTIAYEYTSLNPDKHVENTMAAVKALKR